MTLSLFPFIKRFNKKKQVFFLTSCFTIFAFLLVVNIGWGQTNNYFGTSGTISGSVWSTNPAGPYTSAFNTTGGGIMNFGNTVTTITGATLTVAGINATASVSGWSAGGTISNLSNGVITVNVSGTNLLDFGTQTWTSSGTAGYNKTGTGALAWTGGTFGGGFTLSNGTLVLRGTQSCGSGVLNLNGGVVAANANRTIANPTAINIGGDLQFGEVPANVSLASNTATISFSDNVDLGGTTRTLTLGNSSSTTFSGAISNGGVTVNANANGSLGSIILTGGNLYSGLTTVSGGTLQLNRTGGTTIPITNNVTISGGTLKVSTNQTVNDLTLSSGTLTVDAGTTLTINGTYNATGGTINNLGTIIYTGGSVTFPGTGVTINNGSASTLTNLSIASSGTVTLGTALTVSGTLTLTSGTLTVGANTLTISGSSPTRTSGTIDATNASATVAFTNSSAISLPAGLFGGTLRNLTLNGVGGVSLGASLDVTGLLTLTSGNLTVGANSLTINASPTGSGSLLLDNGSILRPKDAGGQPLTIGNTINISSGTATIPVPFTNGTDLIINGNITGSGAVNVTSDNNGRWLWLSGAKSFSGGITLDGSSSSKPTIRLDNTGSLGTGTLTSTITGSVGYIQTLADLSGGSGVANNISISGASHYLNVNADGSSHLQLSGIISGSGIVTKIGSATLSLTGANTYTGLTTVSDGTLQLNRSGGTTIPATNNVTVSSTGNLKISTNQTLNDLSVASGTLTVDNGATLTINGTFTGGGTIVNNGKIVIVGPSTFPGATTTISTMNDLEINRAGGVSLDKNLNVTGTLTVTSGTLTTNGNLILKSTASATARVAPVLGSISGNVTVERYIPAARKWRPVTAPLIGSSNNSIYYNWQNNGTNDGLTGVELWRPGGSNGLTDNGNSTNILSYTGGSNGTGSGGYTQLTATNDAGSLFNATTPKAFLLFATGPYGSTNYSTIASPIATTLKATGTLFQGNYDLTGLAAGYHLIPNPYPSAITFNPGTNMTVSNIPDIIYIWDPKISTVNSSGGYQTTNAGITSPGGGSYSGGNSRIIPNGSAFFIKVNDATTGEIHLTEACKASSGDFNVFGRGNANGQEVFRANLLLSAATDVLTDGVATVFGATYTATPSNEDAEKFNSPTNGIALRRANKNYAIELRPYLTTNDTIFLRLLNMQQSNYKLELKAEYFNVSSGMEAFLQDTYTNTTTPVSLATDTYYNFNVDANASSTGDRFIVVFRNPNPLPVNITTIKATQKDQQVVVDWTVENEINIKEYQVQKSVDGNNFENLHTIKANNSKTYSSIDVAPNQGANYYRVVGIGNDGSKQYSRVVIVKMGERITKVSVYPNPIKGHTINLQLQNTTKGDYELQIINSIGQVLFRKPIQHNGGSATQTVQLPSNVAKGNYILKLANQETILYSEKVIIE